MVTLTLTDIPKGVPKWKASVIVDDEGVVYAAAGLMPMGEQQAVLAASFDGVDMVQYLKHVFIPLEWMIEECPAEAALWSSIKSAAERHRAEHPSEYA